MSDPTRHSFSAADGTGLVWHESGPAEGRPTILIHGYVSNAQTNWIRYGHAAKVAALGRRVIMPDLRGHGQSDRPHEAAAYPPDVLAADGFALIDALGLVADGGGYDLVGYSLGARTAVRMMAQGARPGRAVLAGMGLAGILDTQGRGGYFRRVLSNPGTFARGTSEWMTEAFVKTTKGDPQALLGILNTFVDTPRAALDAIDLPILVVAGEEDDDNGPAADLAEALPDARFQAIPGNHMSAVMRPELGDAIAGFLR